MKNKVLVEVMVPSIEKSYDIFVPVSRKIGNIIVLLNKALYELTNGDYVGDEKTALYNTDNGEQYPMDSILKDTNIRNGTKVILL